MWVEWEPWLANLPCAKAVQIQEWVDLSLAGQYLKEIALKKFVHTKDQFR